jgi:hypothetical protein
MAGGASGQVEQFTGDEGLRAVKAGHGGGGNSE